MKNLTTKIMCLAIILISLVAQSVDPAIVLMVDQQQYENALNSLSLGSFQLKNVSFVADIVGLLESEQVLLVGSIAGVLLIAFVIFYIFSVRFINRRYHKEKAFQRHLKQDVYGDVKMVLLWIRSLPKKIYDNVEFVALSILFVGAGRSSIGSSMYADIIDISSLVLTVLVVIWIVFHKSKYIQSNSALRVRYFQDSLAVLGIYVLMGLTISLVVICEWNTAVEAYGMIITIIFGVPLFIVGALLTVICLYAVWSEYIKVKD